MTSLTADNLVYLIGMTSLLTLLLQAYNAITRPQIKSEKNEGLMSLQIKELAAQMINLRDNHIHTMQVSLDSTNDRVGDLTTKVAVLTQIIDERIPRK